MRTTLFKTSVLTLMTLAGNVVHAQNMGFDETGLNNLLNNSSSPAPNIYVAPSANSYTLSNVPDFNQVLASSGIPSSQVSFYAQAIKANTPLVSQNASRVQNPASVIKLVTSYAALKTFGPEYKWRTELLSAGRPDGSGVLSQPIYLKGSGDPQLVVEKIEALVQGLNKAGVKELNAPIIVDRSIFQDEQQDASSFDGEPSMPYNAQPDAALMNFRALSFTFDPSVQAVKIVPALSNYSITDTVQWVQGACPANGWKSTLRLNDSGTGATVGGQYYSDCGVQQWHVHAYQMSANDYAQGILQGFMNPATDMVCFPNCSQSVIRWNMPSVQDGRAPLNAKVLSEVWSNPLSSTLKDMNYFSNNVMARQIYLGLSAKTNGQGSLAASEGVVRQVLSQQGLSANSLSMGNGSGLSRATAISAEELGKMLVEATDEPALYDSLPVIGISGTVKNRLLDTDMVGRGHIKTGTLNDVRAIAGYIDGKNGTRYAIVSIIQGANAQTAAGKRVHDAFMQWVGEQ